MTYKLKAAVILTALVVLLTLGWAQRAGGEDHEAVPAATTTPAVSRETGPAVPRGTTDEQEKWLADLEQCESRGNPGAINPEDRDGTPSYGLLQFKPSTFEMFAKAYGIEGELMDPDAQRNIVRRMMHDPSVRWETQFPDCVKKYIGRPPGVL